MTQQIIRSDAPRIQAGLHPFNDPSQYIYCGFNGATPGEFILETSNGGTATVRVGSCKLETQVSAEAGAACWIGSQGLFFGQSIGDERDVFRVRLRMNPQTVQNCALTQAGFIDWVGSGGVRGAGVWFELNPSLSNFWRIKARKGFDSNQVTEIETLVNYRQNLNEIDTFPTRDFQIVAGASGADARFYIDQVLVGMINTNIPRLAIGMGASVNRLVGSSQNCFASLDSMGGGAKQLVSI